jgi:hypothetical protein
LLFFEILVILILEDNENGGSIMKAVKVTLTIVGILTVIAGAIYALATFGDKITAWCRKALDTVCGWFSGCTCCTSTAEEITVDAPAEESDFAEEN